MSVKRRRFDMGLGMFLESPDLLDLMQANVCDHFDEAEEMQYYNGTDPLPDDVILFEQNELFCLPPKRHSDCLDKIGVPLQERLTVCIMLKDPNENEVLTSIEGAVIDRWMRNAHKRVFLLHPAYSGPYPDPETVEHLDPTDL